jgi:hypothetical protein
MIPPGPPNTGIPRLAGQPAGLTRAARRVPVPGVLNRRAPADLPVRQLPPSAVAAVIAAAITGIAVICGLTG